MKSNFELFSKKYPLSKTLKFELRPIGKTTEHIETKGIITRDEERAESYKLMKKTIDEYHKFFIELAMNEVSLTGLKAYEETYLNKKSKTYKKDMEAIQNKLRKEIVSGFSSNKTKDIFSKLDKKELITQVLEDWIQNQQKEKLHFDESFKTFTTYFKGFHENRKNIYTDKPQSTGIAYRLIHENLPKFIDNKTIYQKAKESGIDFSKVEKELEPILQGISLDEIFALDYFNHTLTQKGIHFYNYVIGGYTKEDGKTKLQGINETINLWNQKQDKNNRIPKMKPLYKQILSDRDSISFLLDRLDTSQEVLDAIEEYYKFHLIDFQPIEKEHSENVLIAIRDLLKELAQFNLQEIYIRNGSAISDISQALFGDYSIIKSALVSNFISKLTLKKGVLSKKQEDELEKYLKRDYFSIQELEDAIFQYKAQVDDVKSLQNVEENSHPVADYFHLYFVTKSKAEGDKVFDFVSDINAKYSAIKGILGTEYPKDKILYKDKNVIANIKAFLDSIQNLLHFVKPLYMRSKEGSEVDKLFYNQFDVYYDQLAMLTPLYNKVRNYASQKPYSTEKIKLNFENSTLLNGWDANKEEANTSLLFIKDNNYYLGIMDMKSNKVFRKIKPSKNENVYKKVNYKLLPGASKMLPKVFFSQKSIAFYNPDEHILKIRNHGSHTKGGKPQDGYEKSEFNKNDCHDIIDFFKSSIDKHPDWSQFGFEFTDTKQYQSIDEFYREVEQQGYEISYTPVDEDYIHQLIDEGKLYLFQIYSKDFSSYSKGKPNLHTLYWKALFDPENLKDVVYKLNGEAEVFYRKKSIDAQSIITHPAHQSVENKNPLNEKKQSEFNYDIIKDRRFTVDKFHFHVPITLNFKSSGNDFINFDVLDVLKNNRDVKIIGIDRGERHLIYITLIDQQGNILYQSSLNEIVSDNHPIITNYQNLLDKKEKERAEARVNWGVIETIKELKEGYISQVVHQIATMMVDKQAIVVMEDLNFGFKRGRFKVEKQVYQKLEKMLIDKLNYLVFKDKKPTEEGGLYQALQLSNKFKSFKDMGKQSGFIFYVPAWNTSKIDPTTGFVNLFYLQYESVNKSQNFFALFDSIRYNQKENYFEFQFDYDKFTNRAEGSRSTWTVCTHGDRIMNYRNPNANSNWDHKTVDLTQELEDLLGQYHITYGDGDNIQSQIAGQSEAKFFKSLISIFKLTLQMRNSISNTDVDYLVSPVKNKEGVFFDTRKANANQPKDADANGAYHIAKKGLWVLEQIHAHKGESWKGLKLAISNKEWLKFAQQQ